MCRNLVRLPSALPSARRGEGGPLLSLELRPVAGVIKRDTPILSTTSARRFNAVLRRPLTM